MPPLPSLPQPRSILIVDDEPAFGEMLGLMLEQAGHRVVLAADGAAGISYLKKKPFDLVLTDLLMPEMDGMEFITNVRRLQPAARILAMSGGGHISSNEYLKMASRLGAHEVLAKPFTEEKLLATVRALLAGQGPARS